MLKEFKRFVVGGNMMDRTVGISNGASFGVIVGNLAEDIHS